MASLTKGVPLCLRPGAVTVVAHTSLERLGWVSGFWGFRAAGYSVQELSGSLGLGDVKLGFRKAARPEAPHASRNLDTANSIYNLSPKPPSFDPGSVKPASYTPPKQNPPS